MSSWLLLGSKFPSLSFTIYWHPMEKHSAFIWKYIWKGFRRAQAAFIVLSFRRLSPFLCSGTSWYSSNCNLDFHELEGVFNVCSNFFSNQPVLLFIVLNFSFASAFLIFKHSPVLYVYSPKKWFILSMVLGTCNNLGN